MDKTLYVIRFGFRKMIREQPETKIIYVSRFMMTATNIFNGNAFPDSLSKCVTTCANRLALFLFNLEEVKVALKVAHEDFSMQIISNSKELCNAASSRSDLRLVVYSDGLEYLTALHSALYSLKSFLDVYARLICQLINPNTPPTSFGAKRVNGKEVSGAKFANWIEGNSPSTYEHKENLIDAIYRHSRDWITEAVFYRNTLAHYRDIENMVDMRLPLDNIGNSIDVFLIEQPLLPNGEGLDSYLEEISDRLGEFIDETTSFLPNTDHKLVANWKNSIKYSRGRKENSKPSRNSPCPCGSGKKYKRCHGKID